MTAESSVGSFEQFRQKLREALAHLHDPDFHPPALLCAVMGHDPGHGAGPLQSEIIQVIRDLEPLPNLASDAQIRRDYDLLVHRFVLKLTQEETAEQLHISVRSVRRAQRTATHMLARLLWEHSLARAASEEDGERAAMAGSRQRPAGDTSTAVLDWRAQVGQEMASLQANAPAPLADIEETIRRVVQVESVLASRYGVKLRVDCARPGLVAAIHPAALRQILIMAIGQLARHAPHGEIALCAVQREERIFLTLSSPSDKAARPPTGNVIQEILASQGGSLKASCEDKRVSIEIAVPSAGQVKVLIVDDNLDQVHFYRRCVAGTRYRIVHAAQGQRTVQSIQGVAPDVIVLDILLPDADGWELLADLQQHPPTASIPVIICSIIAEERLAELLGAKLYLPKPVHHTAFIQALAKVLDPGAAAAPPGRANSATGS